MGQLSRILRKCSIGLIVGLALSAGFGLFDLPLANATEIASSTEQVGKFGVKTAVYKFKPNVDPDILPNQATEIWARVYWPSQLRDPKGKKRPLILFLHGNHGTCGTGSAPRSDSSCQYTNEGACPPSFVVTPNHEGYKYAAEHLASWGYVVASINANRGITCGGGNSDDWGLVLARGRLILRHLEFWQKWATHGGAPSEFGDPNLFKGVIDIGQVGLMGHSRGGEGVRAALNIFRDKGSIWPARIPGLDIRALFEIGAVDGQSDRVLDAPSVSWNQLLPLCDGDVSDLQGRNPFERMLSNYFQTNEAEARPTSKSLQMVWGANHNFFNTEWQSTDSYGCVGEPTHKPLFSNSKIESNEQKSIAMQSMTGFFRASVGSEIDPSQAEIFDPAFALPRALTKEGIIDRDFIPSLELGKSRRIDDFTGATGKNVNGPDNAASGVSVSHNKLSTPPVARIEWQSSGEDQYFQINFTDPKNSWDVTAFDFLDFRVGRTLNNAEKDLTKSVDFSLALIDHADRVSRIVSLSQYAQLMGPPNDNTELTQTVRIPLKDFGANLSQLKGVRFIFNQTEKAEIRLAQVRFGVKTSRALPGGLYGTSLLKAFSATIGKWMNSLKPAPSVDKIRAGHLRVNQSMLFQIAELQTSAVKWGSKARPELISEANWTQLQMVNSSQQLMGARAMEMTIRSRDGFPVMDELPVLRIGNELFPVSRYPSSGQIHSLIFSVPLDAYRELKDGQNANVQYGLGIFPKRSWTLPPLKK